MRFQIGEMAIFAVARMARSVPYVNRQCEVMERGDFPPGYEWPNGNRVMLGGNYRIRFADRTLGTVMDYQLRKINPPEEPASLTRHKETQT